MDDDVVPMDIHGPEEDEATLPPDEDVLADDFLDDDLAADDLGLGNMFGGDSEEDTSH